MRKNIIDIKPIDIFFMTKDALPKNFIYLNEVDSTIIQNIRYYGNENFIGRTLDGYKTSQVILTTHAAEALAQAQKLFQNQGYNIVIYDAYRPQRAVDHIIRWTEDHADVQMKHLYYPRIAKEKLFELKYIMKRSGHSRGSTVDLSIVPYGHSLHELQIESRTLLDGFEIKLLNDGTVDMGCSFDLFDEASNTDSDLIPIECKQRRKYLKSVMEQCGFENLYTEWWHFTLADEPYPEEYFNFPVA